MTKINDINPEICWGFSALPKEVFYPIHYTQWTRYFDAAWTNASLERTKNAIAIHAWNRLSSKQPILKNFKNRTLILMYGKQMRKKVFNPFGETAYGIVAKANCPMVYGESGDLF